MGDPIEGILEFDAMPRRPQNGSHGGGQDVPWRFFNSRETTELVKYMWTRANREDMRQEESFGPSLARPSSLARVYIFRQTELLTESLFSLSFWAESLGSTFPGNVDSWHSGLFKWCTWTWSYHHLIQNGDWRCFNTGDRGRRYWITISKRFVVLHTTTSNKQGFKEIESIVIRSCKFLLGKEKGKKKTSPLVQFYRLL